MDYYDKVDPLETLTMIILSALSVIGLGNLVFIIYFILFLFIYLALKLIITSIFCKNKDKDSIKIKFLEGYSRMPVCHCREVLKVWQTLLIYFVPFVLVYTGMFYLCYKEMGWYGPVLFFLLFIMTFDLLPVIYVLYYKIRYGMDYVSVDRHVYEMTLFSKTYIRENKKAKKRLEKTKV